MAIKFQYNKTSLQGLDKQLKVRERALPTIKSKESALRMEVKRTKGEAAALEDRLENEIRNYVRLSARKIAGVPIPVLDGVEFRIARYSLFSAPSWYADGIELLKTMAETGIEAEFTNLKLDMLERARRRTTQKLNLFEKVQIPGYKDAIRKIKRFMEDEESLSKSSQKIMRANQEKRNEKEAEA